MDNDTARERKQVRKPVTMQLVKGVDDDLIEVIEALQRGDRQTTLKQWLRESQGFATAKENVESVKTQDEILNYLSEGMQYLINNTDWTKTAFTELRSHLGKLFANAAIRAATNVASDPEPPSQESLSQEALNKRANRVRKW